MIMAKKKRGPSLEDKYLGPEPSYGPHNIIGEGEEREKEYHRGASWFYYYENRKKAHNAILHYAKHDLTSTHRSCFHFDPLNALSRPTQIHSPSPYALAAPRQ